MESIKRYLAAEQNCIQLIAQFLLYNDFNATLPIFIEEAVTLDYHLPKEELVKIDHIKREHIQKLLSAFASCNHNQFFKEWDQLVPSSIKEIFDYKKLTFYLYVHFAILPFRNKRISQDDQHKSNKEIDIKYVPKENYGRETEIEPKEIKLRMDVTEEPPSPSVDYDTGNQDLSNQVIFKSHSVMGRDHHAIERKTEKDLKKIDKLDTIKESASPSFDHDTGSLDQSEVVLKSFSYTDKSHQANESKAEKVLKKIDRLDIINESASPTNDYDTDSLDQSEVVVRSFSYIDKRHQPNESKGEKVAKKIDRLDMIKESASPSFNYDTDSLDQSIVILESDSYTEEKQHTIESKTDKITREIKIKLDVIEESASPHGDYDRDSLDQSQVVCDTDSDKEIYTIESNTEKFTKGIKMRLDVIEESASPRIDYDTDSLDQSQVVLESDPDTEKEHHTDECTTANTIEDHSMEETETGMELLKLFLAAEGETYSSHQEFLPFFALPYVVSPDEHASFISLFQNKWLSSLHDSFHEFVHKYSCGEEVAPKIAKMCEEQISEHSNNLPNENNAETLSNTSEVMRRYKQVRRKFSKLHKDHQNLIGVAAELTTALENSVRGQAVDLRSTLNNCAEIFPELFGNISSSTNIPSQTLKVPSVQPLRGSKALCCSELDVYKIKSHLLTASIKTKLLILQAIRWRITKGTCEERDQIITWLTRHDILSVHSDLATSMLQPANTTTPHPMQQSLARLLNAIASLRAGRDYLASSDSLLNQLISSLKQEMNIRLDNITSDMLLATLQKLSLRRRPRLLMIEKAMVEWLVTHLSGECERLYSLEYSTALLLNLCLHIEARERCPESTLKLLTDLLDTGQCQIIPMVAGTLYCLLSHDHLNQTARKMNLEAILTAQIEKFTDEPQIQRQIQTLLKLLRGELPTESIVAVSEEPSEDDLDDPDTLEAELDYDDPVKAIGDNQSGEILLENQYKRIFPSHAIVCPSKGSSDILIQPTTPRSRPPTREGTKIP